MKELAEQIAARVRDVPDFPIKGVVFKDIAPVLADYNVLNDIGWAITDRWRDKIDKIGAFDARGFIFGAIAAMLCNVPLFMIRKAGKLPGQVIEQSCDVEYRSGSNLAIQVDSVTKGDRVVLIDDVLATGGTAHAGAVLVERLGGIVAGFDFVIELEHLNGREKLTQYEIVSHLIT